MSTIRSFAMVAVLLAAILPPAAHGQVTVGTGSATGGNAVAISSGAAATASGSVSIAIGTNAAASGIGSIAIGSNNVGANNAAATGNDAIALGANAKASAVGAAALSAGSTASGTNSVASGFGSVASGAASVAIGNNASATQAGSVAIGSGSVAYQANTVSVGTAGAERRVTNVAAGVSGTDAVNVDQLNAYALGGAAPAVEQLTNRMGALETRVDEVARNSYRGIAGVAAMQGMMPTAPGKTAVNMGLGYYEGESAIGASVAYLSSGGRYNMSGGLSYSGGKSVGRVGVGFQF